jgi:hypothetical protein
MLDCIIFLKDLDNKVFKADGIKKRQGFYIIYSGCPEAGKIEGGSAIFSKFKKKFVKYRQNKNNF